MQIKIQVIIESQTEQGKSQVVEEIACLERNELLPQTLGLKLSEAKEIVASIQRVVTTQQVTEYVEQHQHCAKCGSAYAHKDKHHIILRTLFGKLALNSPRFFTCRCQQSKT